MVNDRRGCEPWAENLLMPQELPPNPPKIGALKQPSVLKPTSFFRGSGGMPHPVE